MAGVEAIDGTAQPAQSDRLQAKHIHCLLRLDLMLGEIKKQFPACS